RPLRTGRSPPAREPAAKRYALLDGPALECGAQIARPRLPRLDQTVVLGARVGDAQGAQLAQPEVAQDGVAATQPLQVVLDVAPRGVHGVSILPSSKRLQRVQHASGEASQPTIEERHLQLVALARPDHPERPLLRV